MSEFTAAFSTAFPALVLGDVFPLVLNVKPRTVKSGDVHSVIFTVKTYLGVPVDLTGATVRVNAKSVETDVVTELAAVLGTGTGEINHMLTGTLGTGTYRVEAEVTIGEVVLTAPSGYYTTFRVADDLA